VLLFYLLNPHRFGGGNIDQVPPEVNTLAATFRRTPGSLTNKMLNLDGSRPNSARHEPELFLRLREPGRFEPLYRRILRAARLEGFGEAAVPDFLGALDDEHSIQLLGQQELGPVEVANALDELLGQQRQLGAAFGFTETETSRLVEQHVRLAQHRFARGVLTNYGWECGFCGFTPGRLSGYGLLIASHVKPWVRSTDKERADVANGICACPTHDSAFDAGLLTVTNDFQIKRASVLDQQMTENESLSKAFGSAGMRQRLLLPATAARPRVEYLSFHQSNVFRG
jgi:putative restriction endonuclease